MTQLPHAQNQPGDRLLTRPQAAVWLSVSRATLDRLIAARDLDVVRVGKSVRITQRALEDYTRRHTTRADANQPRGSK